MKYICLIIIIFVIGCTPKKDISLSNEVDNISKIIDNKNFNPEIVENADTEHNFYNNSIRLKQNLKESDEIINYIKNYYVLIRSDGTIRINDSIVYPYISNSKITDYNHISRTYDGAYVDISEFTILLENSQIIIARIFSPYENMRHDFIYFYSNNNHEATKGYYEYGDAINALKNNSKEIIFNKSKIEITVSSDTFGEYHHYYLKMGPVSEYYNADWIIDRYKYFIIDVYAKENTEELKKYFNRIIEDIKYD
jgi:hypothetical protein